MNSGSPPRTAGCFRLAAAARALVGALGLLSAAALLAGPPEDPATIDVGHPTGHVHDHANQTWPPQPPGMQNAVTLNSPGTERSLAAARQTRAVRPACRWPRGAPTPTGPGSVSGFSQRRRHR